MLSLLLFAMVQMVHLNGYQDIYISNTTAGVDNSTCGSVEQPCRSINYVQTLLQHEMDATIFIASNKEHSIMYYINESLKIPTGSNISLKKWNNMDQNPILRSKIGDETVVFNISTCNSPIATTISISSIDFEEVGLVSSNHSTTINVKDCTVSNSAFNTFQHRNEKSDSILNVTVENSNFNNCSNVFSFMSFQSLKFNLSNVRVSGKNNLEKNQNGIHISCNRSGGNNTVPSKIDISINHCTFQSISSSLILRSKSIDQVLLNITSSIFQNIYQYNETIETISNIDINGTGTIVYIHNSTFRNNTAWRGSALYLEYINSAILTDCKFLNNIAVDGGGACFFQNSSIPLEINRCHFNNNIVDSRNLKDRYPLKYLRSHHDGGAIVNYCNLNIYNALFFGNEVSSFGGAIKNGKVSSASHNILNIINTTIIGGGRSALNGDLIFSTAHVSLKNTTLIGNSTTVDDVIFYQMFDGSVTLEDGFNISCPPNNHIKRKSTLMEANRTKAVYNMLIYYCDPCDIGTYNQSGAYDVITGNASQLHAVDIICSTCPQGGRCDNCTGLISSDNFWGRLDEYKHVNFEICPAKKCCSSHGNPCISYNTCNYNREGILCGQCIDGFSENFISLLPGCVKCTKKYRIIFWVITISLIMLLIVILTLKQGYNLRSELVESFRVIRNYIWCKSCKYNDTSNPSPADVTQRVLADNTSSNPISNYQSNAFITESIDSLTTEPETESITSSNSQGESHAEEGNTFKMNTNKTNILKQIIFFYQIEMSLQISSSNRFLRDLAPFWRNTIGRVIGVTFEGKETFFPVCPLMRSGALTNEYIFISIIITTILLFSAIAFITGMASKDEMSVNSLHFKMKCALVDICLLMYIPFASSGFKLHHCIDIDGFKFYNDANKDCPSGWISVPILIWAFLLPISMRIASDFLKRELIGVSWAIFCVIYCPIGIIILLAVLVRHVWKIKKSQLPDEISENGNDKIYYVVYGVFGTLKSDDKEKNQRVKKHPVKYKSKCSLSYIKFQVNKVKLKCYQAANLIAKSGLSIVLYRNLTLSLLQVKKPEPIVRMYSILVTLVMSVGIYNFVKPWQSKVSQQIEFYMNLVLCYLCAINIFWSFNFMANIIYTDAFASIGRTFLKIEMSIMIIGAILGCLVVVTAVVVLFIFVVAFCIKKLDKESILKKEKPNKGRTETVTSETISI